MYTWTNQKRLECNTHPHRIIYKNITKIMNATDTKPDTFIIILKLSHKKQMCMNVTRSITPNLSKCHKTN